MKLETMSISFQHDNGNRKILNNVSVSLENGERAGLTAPSGFKKTTFCKILIGYEEPDRGTMVLDGKNISSCAGYNPVQMIRQHLELSINPRPKVREVLREGDSVEGRVVHGLEIEPDQLNRYPGELSGGELQRPRTAKALGKRTQFIPADRVSTILDLITQSQIWGFLLEGVKARDLGLSMVSHSKELLERVCGRVVDLRTDQGRSGRMVRMQKDWRRDGQAVWI